MTNGDKIRQMSNEELVKVLSDTKNKCIYCAGKYKSNIFCNADCIKGIKAYLDMEAE